MTVAERLLLTLRVVLEAGVVVALGWWGYHTGEGGAGGIALGIVVPAAGFGIWGSLDFRGLRFAEPLRLLEELGFSGVAALAWYDAGRHGLGIALAALSVGYHALVYLSGARLLDPQPGRRLTAR